MSYTKLTVHGVNCVQITPTQELDGGMEHREILIRTQTYDGKPDTVMIDVYGPNPLAILAQDATEGIPVVQSHKPLEGE